MKAFVTGATGFLGTHLIQELDREGFDIIALHRPNSDVSELKKCRKMTLAPGDVTDADSLVAAMPKNVDFVFHVAGSVAHLPHAKEGSRYDVNQLGTRNVVDACLARTPGRLVHTSTVLTYDFHACRPLTEDAPKNLWITDAYARSKRLADEEVEIGARAGIDSVYLHPSAMFGAYDKATWSKMFLEVARGLPLPIAPPGGGSVCHARPVATAHVKAALKGQRDRHYILGGPDVSWFEVLNKIASLLNKRGAWFKLPTPLFKAYGWSEFTLAEMLGREPILTPHSITMLSEEVFSDSSRAIQELDYQPSTLEEMLTDCYQWMADTGRLTIANPDFLPGRG